MKTRRALKRANLASSGDEQGSESEYEAPRASISKRQKTSNASKPTATKPKAATVAKPKRRRKDLSLLPTVPLDVLYEILRLLGPKDLLSLARTNKLWRSTVLNPEATFLWRDARVAFDAPDPPNGYTEEAWAELLFMSACQCCGNKRSLEVDWHLLRRVCKACKQKHLLYEPRFKSTFPGEQDDVLYYVRHTPTGITTRANRNGTSRYYWDEDIKRALQQLKTLPPAELKTWKMSCLRELYEHDTMVEVYEQWSVHLHELTENDAEANRENRLKAVTQRFVEAGYSLADIESTFGPNSHGICTGTPHVTNAVWRRLRPQLEPRLVVTVNQRVEEELKSSVEARMKILEELYEAYLDRACRPSERCYCPPVGAFRPIPDFMRLIEADKELVITAEDFQSIKDNWDKHLAEYQEGKKNDLITLIPKDRVGLNPEPPCDLARHVFRRRLPTTVSYYGCSYAEVERVEDRVLVGWPMIGTHWLPGSERLSTRPGVYVDIPPGFSYQESISRISSRLIALAGLDPENATVQDMDLKDPRFVHNKFDTAAGYPVFTWRAALGHAFSLVLDSFAESQFRLATAEEEAETKENEKTVRAAAKAWSCNHCTQYLLPKEADTRDSIIEHLRTVHEIASAQQGKDLFVNERCRHAFEKPYELVVPDVEKYKCTCPSCTRIGYRRFTKADIEAHVKGNFSFMYRTPIEGTDYYRVPSGLDALAEG